MGFLSGLGVSEGRAWQQGDYENGGTPGKLVSWLDNALTGNRDYQRTLNLNAINNAFNAMEAQKQRDYEERLSNTAYQRAAADAAAAGYNPGLIMGQGGASTPSGSAARSSGATAFRSGDQFGSMLSGLFGLVGSLVATGMRTSAMEAAQDIRGKYTIDAAKLRGNNALVISKNYSNAAMDRVKARNEAAMARDVVNNAAALHRMNENNKAAMDRVVQAGKGRIEVANIHGDNMRDVAERYTPEYDERLAKSDIRYIEFMRKMKAKYGYRGRK